MQCSLIYSRFCFNLSQITATENYFCTWNKLFSFHWHEHRSTIYLFFSFVTEQLLANSRSINVYHLNTYKTVSSHLSKASLTASSLAPMYLDSSSGPCVYDSNSQLGGEWCKRQGKEASPCHLLIPRHYECSSSNIQQLIYASTWSVIQMSIYYTKKMQNELYVGTMWIGTELLIAWIPCRKKSNERYWFWGRSICW